MWNLIPLLLYSGFLVNGLLYDDCNYWNRSPVELAKVYPRNPHDPFLPPSCGKKASPCNAHTKYRTFDGTCNNLKNPEWGMPNSTYGRLLASAYSDGISAPRMANDKSPLPGARRVRQAVLPTGTKSDKTRSLALMQFGQFIAHDMSLQVDGVDGRCCSESAQPQDNYSKFCFPIKISPNDSELGNLMTCMNFTRTLTDKDINCTVTKSAPAQQLNAVTSWLDLSLVYDNSKERNDALRDWKDGLMTVVVRNGKSYPQQDTTTANVSCVCNRVNETVCYGGGDTRINQSPHLTILQIIMLREHNRLATELKKINPTWTDDKLFHEARRINIAKYQYIVYYEWMPQLLGYRNLVENQIIYPHSTGYVNDYDCSVAPNVLNEHAHAAYRHFHSQIAGMLKVMNEHRVVTNNVNIADFLFRPSVLETDDNFSGLARGLISQFSEGADDLNVKEITNQMFACNAQKFGTDLRSFDIQRDRDHALGYYASYRHYYGIGPNTCFDDFTDYISQDNINKLKTLYKSHLDVDLSIGGALEQKFRGSLVGPTFLNILLEQFKRTRQADRFWFEHEEAGFTLAQLAEIRKSSLSRLFCDNGTGIKKIQINAFLAVKNAKYDLKMCSEIPVVDLRKWKEI